MMDETLAYSHPFRRANLAQRKPTRFALMPDAQALATIAKALGLIGITRASFRGQIKPLGRADFALEAVLEATVVQPCVATLAPVTTVIREPVSRRYLADWKEPDAEESETPEDDSAEPLGDVIDAGAVMVEALVLALPLYPRADGASAGDVVAAPPGAKPLTDAALRPFAGLADLLKKKTD